MSFGTFTAADWYWLVGADTTHVYTSARNAIVPLTDATYVAWDAVNDAISIDSALALFNIVSGEATTAQALTFYGLYAPTAPLPDLKIIKQSALDIEFDANFDIPAFIRGGNLTTVSAANVGAFIAQITNNYRSLRASISGAATVNALTAIDITSGWPANP